MTNDNGNPNNNSAGQQPQPTNAFPGVTLESVKLLEKATRDHDLLSEKIGENIKEARKFNSEVIELSKNIDHLGKSIGGFNEGLDSTESKLKLEIETLEKFSFALREKFYKNLEDSAAAQRDMLKIQKELGESLGTLEDKSGDLTKAKNEYNHSLQTEKQLLEEIEKLKSSSSSDPAKQAEIMIELGIKQASLDAQKIVSERALVDLQETQKEQDKFKLQQSHAELKTQTEKISKNNEEILTEIGLSNAKKLTTERTAQVSKAAGGLIDKLTRSSSETNIFTSAMISASGGLGKLTTSILGSLNEAFWTPEKAMNRFFNFLYKNLIQSTFEFDKMLTSINKSTGGMGKEFEQVGLNKVSGFAASTMSGLAEYGVGLQEAGAAYTALSNKVNGFNNLSIQQRRILTENAATMENLGVSAQTYAELTSKFMGSIGKTADGTKNVINDLAKDAIAAGRNVGEYTKEFEQLMPKIIGFGREATTIFKELNAMSAMTKGVMSAGDLQSFASQFDNWDSAAEAVSKLNAGLGGTSLNIQDLMRADPTEKLMMLKRAFDESGQDFDKLNIGYKRLLAESFGGDVAKAASFFKGDLAEANRMMHEQAESEKELEERKKKSVEATKKLEKALEGVKIAFLPIIDGVAKVAGWISKLNSKIGGFATFLVGLGVTAVPALIGVFKLFSMAANTSIGIVLNNAIIKIRELATEIQKAKVQAASIPAGGGAPAPGGGTPPPVNTGGAAAPKGGFRAGFASGRGTGGSLTGILLSLGLGAAMAAMSSSTTNNTSTPQQNINSAEIDSSTQNNHDGIYDSKNTNNNDTYVINGGRTRAVFNKDIIMAGAKTEGGLSKLIKNSSSENKIKSNYSDINRAEKIYQATQQSETTRIEKQKESDQIFKQMNENLEKIVKKDQKTPEFKLEVDGSVLASIVSEKQGMVG